MSGIANLHALFADACFGETAEALGDLDAYLALHGVDGEDAAALREAPRRLGLYRALVRHNVVNVVGTMLERTRARLEHVSPGLFDRSMDAFLAARGPQTPHLRDVPSELLAWVTPRWREDARVPAYLADFAAYELSDFTVGVAPRPAPPPALADVTAHRALVFADPHVVVRLAWAVHLLAPDDLAASPEQRPVSLLVYRDDAHQTRFLDLSPLAGAILERLFAGSTLAGAMVEACASSGFALDDAVLKGAAQLLADLGERGVLLGARE
jgi:hypothetical protein